MAFFVNDKKVLENDGAFKIFDAQPGSFKQPIIDFVKFQQFPQQNPGVISIPNPEEQSTRHVWGGGFDYTQINANTAFKLTAYDGAASDQFGHSVAVGSGVIVVGAPGDDDNGSSSGSVYLYNIKGTLITKIKPSDGAAGDQFGYSVAVGSGRIVVGAPGADVGGINSSGAAYIFDLAGGNQIKLTGGTLQSFMGVSVAINCNRVVVGLPEYSSGGYTNSGLVKLFKKDGTFLKNIVAPDAYSNDFFGQSVAINNGRIAIGAPGAVGSVYLYDLGGTHFKTIREPTYDGITIPVIRLQWTAGSRTVTATKMRWANGINNFSTYGPNEVMPNYVFPDLQVGQFITVAGLSPSDNQILGNTVGTWRINSVSGDTFTFDQAAVENSSFSITSKGFDIDPLRFVTLVDRNISATVTSFTADGSSTVTVTMPLYRPTPPNSFQGMFVTVSGTSSSNLNGTWRIANFTGGSTFTITTRNPVNSGTYSGTITFNDTKNFFGNSVSISGGRIAVGCPFRKYYNFFKYRYGQLAYTFNRVTFDTSSEISYGAVYLYDLNGTYCGVAPGNVGFRNTNGYPGTPPVTAYNSTTSYSVPATSLNSQLGHSVALGSGFLIAGAPTSIINSVINAGSVFVSSCRTTDLHYDAFTGTNASNGNSGVTYNFGPRRTSADVQPSTYQPYPEITQLTSVGYLDKRLISLYSLPAIFPNTTNTASDRFGYSVACGWNTIAISAPYENTSAGIDAGAVYVFKIEENSNGRFDQILDAYGRDD